MAERGHVGLFDLIVSTPLRGRGLGRRLVGELLRWGMQSEAAHTAYLQVVQTNEPARRLYSGLGFLEQYTYWYRVRPASDVL